MSYSISKQLQQLLAVLIVTHSAAICTTSAQERVRIPPEVLRENAVVLRRNARALPAQESAVDLQVGEYVFAHMPGVVNRSTVMDTARWTLPYRLEGIAETGLRVVLYTIVDIAGEGLRLHQGEPGFSTTAYLWVRDSLDPRSNVPLGNAVTLVLMGELDSVEPDVIEITRTNTPVPSRLASLAPDKDTLEFVVRPSFADAFDRIPIRVVRPRMSLTASPKKVQAFGIGSVRLTITAEGHPQPAGINVVVSSNTLDTDSPLKLDANGHVTTRLRSAGVGQTTIEARAAGFRTVSDTVEMVFPWFFLVAVLIGSVLGSVVRACWKGCTIRKYTFWLLTGFLFALLLVAGFRYVLLAVWPADILDAASASLVGQCAFAALGAAFAPSAMKKLGAKLEGKS